MTTNRSLRELAGKPEFEGKIEELTTLLEMTRREYGDDAPLFVANPAASARNPPTPGSEQPGKKG